MSRGVELSSSSTMRSLFARNDDPVSVTSTIASTNSCAFISVAPQENSTSACTPCFFRYFFVRLTTSVAMRLPSRSFTDFTGESSGTHNTQPSDHTSELQSLRHLVCRLLL